MAFRKINTNRDRFIDQTEIEEVMAKMGRNKSDAKKMIAKADRNGDGKLDFQEFNKATSGRFFTEILQSIMTFLAPVLSG